MVEFIDKVTGIDCTWQSLSEPEYIVEVVEKGVIRDTTLSLSTSSCLEVRDLNMKLSALCLLLLLVGVAVCKKKKPAAKSSGHHVEGKEKKYDSKVSGDISFFCKVVSNIYKRWW